MKWWHFFLISEVLGQANEASKLRRKISELDARPKKLEPESDSINNEPKPSDWLPAPYQN